MHGISNIGGHSIIPSSQGVGINTPASQSNFQIAAPAAPSQSATQGVSSSASQTLGSQSVSTLLQTQDIGQPQIQGGGHGGGGHHTIKMTPALEAEEAEQSEEAQALRQRKKLSAATTADETEDADETEKNGETAKDKTETTLTGSNKQRQSGHLRQKAQT